MAKPGRNAPCPCGSGVKYKRCCGRGGVLVRGFVAADRESVLRKLARFVAGPGWHEVVEEAADEFWEPVDPGVTARLDEVAELMSESVFDCWLFYDFELEPGHYVVDAFLEATSGLSQAERRYLQTIRRTAMRLYEVTEVRPGESIVLRDIFSADVLEVRERSGSQGLSCWTLVAARVTPRGASGQPEIDGGMLPIARLRRAQLVEAIEEELTRGRELEPEASERELWTMLTPLLHAAWRNPMRMPKLVNYDGDAMVLTTVRFDVDDPERFAAAFDGARAR